MGHSVGRPNHFESLLFCVRRRVLYWRFWLPNGLNISTTAPKLSKRLQKRVGKLCNIFKECERNFIFSSFSQSWTCLYSVAGIHCNGSFDVFVCWPHSLPGNVSVPCPSYLPWINDGNLTCFAVYLPAIYTFLLLFFKGPLFFTTSSDYD